MYVDLYYYIFVEVRSLNKSFSSLMVIEDFFHGLRVNLDLHTMPGSQNGYDHLRKLS